MGNYVSTSQIAAHLPYRTIDGSSSPNTTQVGEWIDEAEALLDGALATIEITTPITAAAGIKICRVWATDAVVGQVRQAFAAAGGDGTNDAGEEMITRFNDRISDIFEHPMRYSAMLAGGAGGDASRQIRSYVTDNADSKTVDDGDFDPTFTTAEVF